MRAVAIKTDVRHSCLVHARLLDAFIALTTAELDRQGNGFVSESLTELLESLREERKVYGVLGGIAPAPLIAIGNAACLRAPESISPSAA